MQALSLWQCSSVCYYDLLKKSNQWLTVAREYFSTKWNFWHQSGLLSGSRNISTWLVCVLPWTAQTLDSTERRTLSWFVVLFLHFFNIYFRATDNNSSKRLTVSADSSLVQPPVHDNTKNPMERTRLFWQKLKILQKHKVEQRQQINIIYSLRSYLRVTPGSHLINIKLLYFPELNPHFYRPANESPKNMTQCFYKTFWLILSFA